jgi:hypothetical protein
MDVYWIEKQLPSPLDDTALDALEAAGTATIHRMGTAIIIRGKRLTMDEWVARHAERARIVPT